MKAEDWIKVEDRQPECTFGDGETMHYSRSVLVAMRWINGDTKETYFPKELEEVWVEERENPSKNIDYWAKLEHQYAGMAMQGIIARHNVDFDMVVEWSADLAHALVKKMKEERK